MWPSSRLRLVLCLPYARCGFGASVHLDWVLLVGEVSATPTPRHATHPITAARALKEFANAPLGDPQAPRTTRLPAGSIR